MVRLLGSVAVLAWAVVGAVASASMPSILNTTTTWVTRESAAITGVERLDIGVGCGAETEYTSVPSTEGSPTYSYVIENPLAEFISVHFSDFNLPDDDYVVVRAVDADTEKNSYRYRGRDKRGEFFANALFTKAIVLELYTTGTSGPPDGAPCVGFKVDSYRYLAQAAGLSGAPEEVCGRDDSQEAACFRAYPTAFERSRAVARLLIHKNGGSFFCTGWLVGCEGHMITNNHCISTQAHASNFEIEFNAQGSSCSTACNQPMGCRGTVRATSATLIATDADLDYTLLKLPVNLINDYGYLTLREGGAKMNERIYVPQHPAGYGKRIAMKTDTGYGTVESLTMSGCAVNQVAYSLDTMGGSSGSPVLAWSDNAVVALHHCGGCPNTAINANKLIADMRRRNVLPRCAIFQAQAPVLSTTVDGTIFSTSKKTTVDYIDFVLATDADVELDVLSMETVDGQTFVDVNKDCNSGHLDTSMVLFSLSNNGISAASMIAANNDAPYGYGQKDGSISRADSYLFLPLKAGRYRLAVSAAPLTTEQAVAKSLSGAMPRVCNAQVSNYGSYRVTLSTSGSVQVVSPNSYIGSQCNNAYSSKPYPKCDYHREAPLNRAYVVDGSIVRSTSSMSVDHIPFTVNTFGRVTIEVSSFETKDGFTFLDVNGDCESAYIDPVAYLFQRANRYATPTVSDLINAGDNDGSFAVRRNRRSVSYRDPYFSLPLPAGEYLLVVGRAPLSVQEAIAKVSTNAVNQFTPESCGRKSNRGNYMVTFGTSQSISAYSPNSFQGRKCSANVGKVVCYA